MGWWSQILRSRADDWTFGRLDPSQTPGNPPNREIQPEAEYLSVFVRSLRVCNVRKGISRFYGTVHSFISLPASGARDPVAFHTLTTPEGLRNLDSKNLNRVVTLNRRVLGPVPYRGGDLDIELGLFSIKAAELADPFLSVLEELSSLAGVGIVATAKPFVGPLKRGIGLLTDSADSDILEIGLAKTFNPVETGQYVVMRARRDQVEIAELTLDAEGRLLRKGAPIVEYPYVVIGIDGSATRPDWREIPDVAEAYGRLRGAVERQRFDDVQAALSAFKISVYWCPDLLAVDAKRIFEIAETQTKQALGAVQTSAGAVARLPALAEIEL